MTLIRPHSQTIDSKTTRDSTINRENSDIGLNKQQSSDKNIYKLKEKDSNNINKKEQINENNIIVNNTNAINEEKEKLHNHNNDKKVIEQKKELELTYEELIKKIIYDNFLDNNISLIYHFCQQCFSFMKIEEIYNQILNYIEIIEKENNNDINLEEKKFNNIYEFSKILLIEMIYYYIDTKIDNNILAHAKKLCYKLISKIIIDSRNNDEEINIKKKELINDNLNVDINDIKIFILKKDTPKNLKEENNNLNKNEINFKKSNLSKMKHCKTTDKKVNFEEQNNKDNKNMIKDIKEEQIFRISRSIRLSTKNFSSGKNRIKNIIIEDEKSEKSDDEKHKINKSSDNSDSDNTISDNNNELNLYSDDENNSNKDFLNNLMKDGNLNEKNIISIKEEEIYILGNIMKLLEKYQSNNLNNINKEEDQNIMKYFKNNINFYKKLQKKLNKEKKVLITPRQRQKRYTNTYTSFFTQKKPEKIEIIRDYLSKGYFCVIDWKKEEIGDKLMSVSKKLISKIKPRELYKGVFLKKNKEITSPNVVECINEFNKLTTFVMEDILSYNSPKDRAKIYDKWVSIAEYCKNIKDYNDLIAIFSAFNHYIITGLKLTLKEIKSKTNSTLKIIKNFCTVEGNYKRIREDMDLCDKNGEIFIPYLGMLLRDINFFEEKSKYINDKGYINFNKIEKIDEMFKLYFKFKIKDEEEKNKINNDIVELDFFDDLENITEEYLENVANQIEPENKKDTSEKKRLTNTDEKYFSKYNKNEKEKEHKKEIKENSKEDFVSNSINDDRLNEDDEVPPDLDEARILE